MQAAVDAKHSLIIATEVTNTTSDSGVLGTMAIKAQAALGGNELSVGGRQGLLHGKEVLLCDTIGVSAYVAKPLTSAKLPKDLANGKERFKYDAYHNCYHCPAGRKLTYRFATEEKGRCDHYTGRMTDGRVCPFETPMQPQPG